MSEPEHEPHRQRGQDMSSDPDGTKPSNVKRAYRAYQAYTWWGRLQNFWTWLTSSAPGVVAAGVVGGTAVVAIDDASKSHTNAGRRDAILAAASQVQQKPKEDLGKDAVSYAIRGADKSGRFAEFDVIVLARDFHWVRGSTDQMERGTTLLDGGALQRTLTEAELGQRLARALDLIAVGLASAEGDRATEEARAVARARHLAGILRTASKGAKTIWTLNLGQFTSGSDLTTDATDWQRPILIIGLRSAAAGANLAEALSSAMDNHPDLPKTTSYSRFVLEPAK
jgi:hypothetical protein